MTTKCQTMKSIGCEIKASSSFTHGHCKAYLKLGHASPQHAQHPRIGHGPSHPRFPKWKVIYHQDIPSHSTGHSNGHSSLIGGSTPSDNMKVRWNYYNTISSSNDSYYYGLSIIIGFMVSNYHGVHMKSVGMMKLHMLGNISIIIYWMMI